MPPKTKPKPLSDTEIQQIAQDIEGGRPPMVWFTAAAVGVPEGRSGKVVSLGDPADGDFLQVRPTGSKDVLSFSPTEVTLTKPPRNPEKAVSSKTAQPKSTTRKESTVTQPSTMTSVANQPAPAPVADSMKPIGAQSESVESAPEAKAAAKPAAKPVKSTAVRKAKAPEVTVTLNGTADGEWTVEVINGKKRTVRGLPVQSSAVAQAAKILHPEVAEVVSGILDAARQVQEQKVAALQAELEQARRLLDELAD
ncbi:DUF6319 family protein [Nocardia goodfellowii]|uniref:Cell wall anchor protein n=1 Tax=Nocardia goodfellowii TaxID=882446 RepID=A0ABS4QFT0_9NOCA|nr:DUF6319 family protein [Nocardia goodfellowii]MBP2189536.1 hypothetical protein [Nocardia goodfellowii]